MNERVFDSLNPVTVDSYQQIITEVVYRYQALFSNHNLQHRFENSLVTNPIARDFQAQQKVDYELKETYPPFAMMALIVPGEQKMEDIYYNVAKHVILEVFRHIILGGAVDLDIVAQMVDDIVFEFFKEGTQLPEDTSKIFLVAYRSVLQDIFAGRTVTILGTGETKGMLEMMGLPEPEA